MGKKNKKVFNFYLQKVSALSKDSINHLAFILLQWIKNQKWILLFQMLVSSYLYLDDCDMDFCLFIINAIIFQMPKQYSYVIIAYSSIDNHVLMTCMYSSDLLMRKKHHYPV